MAERNWQNWDTNGAAERIDEYWIKEEAPWRAAVAQELKNHINIEQPVVEIGSGSGLIYEALRDAGVCTSETYTGGDISQSMLAMARKRFPGVRFEQFDIFKLPFADASQPIVLNVHVMQHLPHYKDALTELMRVTARTLIVICWFHQGEEDNIDFSEASSDWGDQRFYNNCYSLPGFLKFIETSPRKPKLIGIGHFGGQNYLIKILF